MNELNLEELLYSIDNEVNSEIVEINYQYNNNNSNNNINNIDNEENKPFIINEESPIVQQPKNILIPLKPHQLAMIYAMKNLEDSLYIPIYGHNNDNFKKWFKRRFCLFM